MRIETLRLAGIGPFRHEQRVDFGSLAGEGIFLIAGRTGAGKSSILDAIVYALYDAVPRFEQEGLRAVRSDHAADRDDSFVELEFTLPHGRYRVHREPERSRPKRRGTGTTVQPARARLEEWREEQWHTLATGAREVGRALHELLPLARAQFLQVVLLAQNRFQDFLLADSAERAAILRALFATGRFRDLGELMDEWRREAAERLRAAEERVAQLTAERDRLRAELPADDAAHGAEQDGFAQARDTALRALLAVQQQRDAARLAAEEATAQVQELQTIAERQHRLEQARRLAAELDGLEPQLAAQRTELERARAVASILPLLDQRERAEDGLDTARRELHELLRADPAFEGTAQTAADGVADSAPDRATLLARAEQAAGRLGALAESLERERQLPELRSAETQVATSLEENGRSLAQLRELLTELPEHIGAARLEQSRLRERAEDGDAAGQAVAEAEERLRQARTARLLGARERAAEEQLATARDERAAAAERSAALLRRRIAQSAGVLAGQLHPDTPCPVCGSRTHPAPAARAADEQISDEALAAAEDAARAAGELAEQRQDELEQLRHARSAALAAAAGKEETQHELARAQAEQRRSQAEAAAERVRVLTATLEADAQRLLQARAEQAAGSAQREELLQRQAELAAQRVQIEHEVAAARGDRPSLAALQERLQVEQRWARDAVTAVDRAAAAASAFHLEEERLAAVLGEASELPEEWRRGGDPEGAAWQATLRELRDAARDAAAVQRLTASIREHEDRRAAVRATLAEPELSGLPAAPVVVAEASERASARRAELEALLSAAVLAAEHHRALAGLAEQAPAAVAEQIAAAERHEVLRGLASALRGQQASEQRMSLEAYVLAARLEEIVAAANTRLQRMSEGRYLLEHDDSRRGAGQSGLGLRVLDAYTGRSRPTRSLSGGETFLASLALALGLSDTVTAGAGGLRLDTLFIDEGFGSLDAQTLEVAMAALDGLRAGGRTIGVISHVETMQEQLPALLRVRRTEHGDSVIEQDIER